MVANIISFSHIIFKRLFPQVSKEQLLYGKKIKLLVEILMVSTCISLNPLPDDKILERSKLKQSADDNSKFDENSRKFSKPVENTVGKGEIARFPQCFQKACFPGASKDVIVWEWVKVRLQ